MVLFFLSASCVIRWTKEDCSTLVIKAFSKKKKKKNILEHTLSLLVMCGTSLSTANLNKIISEWVDSHPAGRSVSVHRLSIVSGSGQSLPHSHHLTSFLLKRSTHPFTLWQKEPYPGGACLSENQWSVWWGPLSVVMKLRGHSSTQTTNPTWPQLTRPWQWRQLEQREQSQSIWVIANTLVLSTLFYP